MSLIREKWNRRYANKSDEISSVPAAVTIGWPLLKQGLKMSSVLDLASGDGGTALFLASKGFDVTAVDIAEEGLKRLTESAQAQQLSIRTQQLDLDDRVALSALGAFDNIVINRFRPSLPLFACLPELLRPQGRLMLNSFNLQQHREKGFSERFCLTHQEYLNISSLLSLEYYRSVAREGDYMDEYLFLKK
ncbi:class I SAM-dependent methyltransferase [Neptunomonas antarctica]|uniref:Methyltransferase domain-containing protein n=1 Tax=Neptunomonas antarctica TaxID=619304 RepID=A0A1N7P2R5_9GAMM|nr:methyltransferase domain-containing protein [Neptunomonas antarctica]SIT04945.1 Methyltransferase domain-containing protein [Neptunomonas antarctica]